MSDKKDPKEIKIDQFEQFKVSEQEQETIVGGQSGLTAGTAQPEAKTVTTLPITKKTK